MTFMYTPIKIILEGRCSCKRMTPSGGNTSPVNFLELRFLLKELKNMVV